MTLHVGGGIAVIGTPSKTSSSLNFSGAICTSSATSFEFPVLENRTASLIGYSTNYKPPSQDA